MLSQSNVCCVFVSCALGLCELDTLLRDGGGVGASLQFIALGLGPPLGMVHYVGGGLQHQPHELLHLKGVVGELGVGSQGGVVTLGRNTETATKPARVSVPL